MSDIQTDSVNNRLQQKDIDNLTENLSRLETSVKTGFDNVYSKLDMMHLKFVQKDMFEERLKNLKTEVDELKDSNKWLYRTVASMVIGIVITAIFVIK